jgi:phosphatidate cytidylyltransferase
VAIGVGVAMAAAFFVVIAVSDWLFLAFIGAFVVIALLELGSALRTHSPARPATAVTIAAALLMLFGTYAFGSTAQVLGLFLLFTGAVATVLGDKRREAVAASLGATALMGLWVAFLPSFIGLLLAREGGIWYVMMAVGLTVTADISAYGWGSGFGRTRLAPRVSPAKSWEGFLGALVTVVVTAAIVAPLTVPGMTVVAAVLVGMALTVSATVGDLAESLVKRDLGVKDLGTILPGHGGVMDRVDAIIWAFPVAHLVLLGLGL